ncbi:MAG: class I SAM-dependent methyltransferase [Nitrososphaerota archaeon]|nr:class I SAM-dependent methyltransferase [Nitrososphaerota archaeon]
MAPFESHAQRYEKWFENHEPAYRSELDAIRTLLPRFRSGIEVGVGTGRFSIPFGITNGIEPARSALRIAHSKDVEAVQAVGEALPFASSSFDFALIVTTICFFTDTLLALKEVFRILEPGGSIVIGFVDKDSVLGRKYARQKESPFYAEATFYGVEEIARLLAESGFHRAEYVQTLFEGITEEIQQPRKGHGAGSFVVVRAVKQ